MRNLLTFCAFQQIVTGNLRWRMTVLIQRVTTTVIHWIKVEPGGKLPCLYHPPFATQFFLSNSVIIKEEVVEATNV